MVVATDERQSQRELMARKRAAARDLSIPKVTNVERRRQRLGSVYQFMRGYFPDVFYQPFTDSRSEMIEAIIKAATESGDQAIAGPRGDGKTRTALFTSLWLKLRGLIDFTLIISKSGKRAEKELNNLKWAIRESNEFAEDFPEIAVPVLALGGWASRARQQTVSGHMTDMEWGVDSIILPTITTELLRNNGWNSDLESCARGQIVSSLGIEGPVRGWSVRNRRPQLAIIDDIDDRESARSDLQTEARIEIIDADVAGLGGPDRNVSRVMLCTLINRTCAAYVFTDPKQRPSFRGQRHKLITKPPDRADLWEQYVTLRNGRNVEEDPDARLATRFYIDHRTEMDAGHSCSNPYRYNQAPLSDGQPAELSALHGYYNFVADKGLSAALTELQNDPPPDENSAGIVLTAYHVRANARSGTARGIVPDNTRLLTAAADVKKTGLHHVTIAWNDSAVGSIIDYDFWPFETQGLKASACEKLILEGLQEWWASRKTGWQQADGSGEWDVDLTLIDEGWKEDGWNQQPVELFCAAVGFGLVMPSKGFSNWRPRTKTKTCIPGANWAVEWKFGFPLVEVNADHWKIRTHEGFLQPYGDAGSLGLFIPKADEWGREPANAHHNYAKHITAEKWSQVNGGRWAWQPADGGRHQKPNHWLDATALAIAAREIRGVSVAQPKQQPEPSRPAPRQQPKPQPQQRRAVAASEAKESWIPVR